MVLFGQREIERPPDVADQLTALITDEVRRFDRGDVLALTLRELHSRRRQVQVDVQDFRRVFLHDPRAGDRELEIGDRLRTVGGRRDARIGEIRAAVEGDDLFARRVAVAIEHLHAGTRDAHGNLAVGAVPVGVGRRVAEQILCARRFVELAEQPLAGHERSDLSAGQGRDLPRAADRERLLERRPRRRDRVQDLHACRAAAPRQHRRRRHGRPAGDAAGVQDVDGHPRVVGERGNAVGVLEPRQEQSVAGQKDEVLLAVEIAQVADAGVEIAEILIGVE